MTRHACAIAVPASRASLLPVDSCVSEEPGQRAGSGVVSGSAVCQVDGQNRWCARMPVRHQRRRAAAPAASCSRGCRRIPGDDCGDANCANQSACCGGPPPSTVEPDAAGTTTTHAARLPACWVFACMRAWHTLLLDALITARCVPLVPVPASFVAAGGLQAVRQLRAVQAGHDSRRCSGRRHRACAHLLEPLHGATRDDRAARCLPPAAPPRTGNGGPVRRRGGASRGGDDAHRAVGVRPRRWRRQWTWWSRPAAGELLPAHACCRGVGAGA